MGNRGFFISHSSSQDEVADKFATTIKDVFSLPTIVDHQDFIGGDNWVVRMFDAITQTDFTICLITQEFLLSTPCMDELSEAYRQNKLLMVLLEDVDVPLRVRVYLDLRGDKGTQKFEKYLRQVLSGDLIPEERVLHPKVAKAAEGEVLVLLCRFTLKGDRADPAGVWADKLSNEVAHKLREYKIKFSFLDLQIESEEEAKALNKEYGSVLVVWGTIGDDYVVVNYTPVDTQFTYAAYKRASAFKADINKQAGVVKSELFYRFLNNAADTEFVVSVLTGWVLLCRNQYQEAYEIFQYALAIDDDTNQFSKVRNGLYFHLGRCALFLGNKSEALSHFKRFQKLLPSNAWGYFYQGMIYSGFGNDKLLLENLEKAVAVSERHPTFLAYLAEYFATREQLHVGVELLNEAIEKEATEPGFYLLRAQCHRQLGDDATALIDYTSAIKVAGENPIPYLARGFFYLEMHEWRHVREDASAALRRGMIGNSAYVLRAQAYVQLGDFRKAMADWNKAIEVEPEDFEAIYMRGCLRQEIGEYEKALNDFSYCLEKSPAFVEALNHRGVCYLQLNQKNKAIQDLNLANELSPDDPYILNNRGLVFIELKQLKQALIDFDRATACDPKYVEPYANRGRVYYLRGSFREALHEYNQALGLAQTDQQLWVSRALVYIRLGSFEEALSDCDAAVQMESTSIAHQTRSRCLYHLGRWQEAIAAATKAIKLDGRNDRALYYRALSFKKVYDFERAIKDLDRALELEPRSKDVLEERQSMHLFKDGSIVVDLRKKKKR